MKIGRLENDIKWNYGIEICPCCYRFHAWEFNVWCFKQYIARETYMWIAEDKKGFFFTSLLALNEVKTITIRKPKILMKII